MKFCLVKPPSYIDIRIFGCLCYAHKGTRVCGKFDERASRCVFLGYPFFQKRWRVYYLEHKEYFVSRDVVSNEDVFPYATPSPPVDNNIVHPSSFIDESHLAPRLSDPQEVHSPSFTNIIEDPSSEPVVVTTSEPATVTTSAPAIVTTSEHATITTLELATVLSFEPAAVYDLATATVRA